MSKQPLSIDIDSDSLNINYLDIYTGSFTKPNVNLLDTNKLYADKISQILKDIGKNSRKASLDNKHKEFLENLEILVNNLKPLIYVIINQLDGLRFISMLDQLENFNIVHNNGHFSKIFHSKDIINAIISSNESEYLDCNYDPSDKNYIIVRPNVGHIERRRFLLHKGIHYAPCMIDRKAIETLKISMALHMSSHNNFALFNANYLEKHGNIDMIQFVTSINNINEIIKKIGS